MQEIRLLVLRLTERCNLHCAYCYAARDDATFDMDEETAIRAIQRCCPEGGKLKIQFTGGEPLLRLDLMEAVYAFGMRTGRKLSLSVQTNGTLLNRENCRSLKAIRCGVGVSLDGVGKANELRCFPDGTPAYDAIVSGIRNLGGVGMRCGLTAVVTNRNAALLGQIPDLALYLGNVSGVGLDLFRPIGRGAEQDFSADENALEVGLRALKSKAQQLNDVGIPFRFREWERIRQRGALKACSETYCYAQTDASFCVDGRGDIWPCSSLAGDKCFYLGNIADEVDLKPRGLLEMLKAPEQCNACASYTQCLGGCPAARQKGINSLTCKMQQVLSESN